MNKAEPITPRLIKRGTMIGDVRVAHMTEKNGLYSIHIEGVRHTESHYYEVVRDEFDRLIGCRCGDPSNPPGGL